MVSRKDKNKPAPSCYGCFKNLPCGCDKPQTFADDAHDEGPICPYCLYEIAAHDSDGVLYDQGIDSYECPNCEREFSLGVSVSFSWHASQERKKDERQRHD